MGERCRKWNFPAGSKPFFMVIVQINAYTDVLVELHIHNKIMPGFFMGFV